MRALRKEHQIDLPPLKRAEFMQDGRAAFENEFLPQVWNAIGDRHILLMLDEAIRLQEQIDAGKLDKSVFEYLRHLMQHSDRLNFLFALGSGLEEMEKEYAFLFSVGLYRKISFLTRDAATALITQPVKDYYKLEPSHSRSDSSASRRGIRISRSCCATACSIAGCSMRRPLLRSDDVNAVLERSGRARPGCVEASVGRFDARRKSGAGRPGRRPWANAAIRSGWPKSIGRGPAWMWCFPTTRRPKRVRSLIARDVIIGEDKYQFAIELQRLWVQKYEKLDWVKEEIASTLQVWQPPEIMIEQRQLQRRSRSDILAVTVILGFFAALIIVLFLGLRSLNESVGLERAQRRTLEAQITRIADAVATATAAAEAPAATATAGAAQLLAERLTSTAVAVECALPPTAVNDFLSRLNELRQQTGVAPLVLDETLSSSAAQLSADRGEGAPQVSDPTVIVVQGCRPDSIWQSLKNDPQGQQVLVSAAYSQVGAAITAGRFEHTGAQVWATRAHGHSDLNIDFNTDQHAASDTPRIHDYFDDTALPGSVKP